MIDALDIVLKKNPFGMVGMVGIVGIVGVSK